MKNRHLQFWHLKFIRSQHRRNQLVWGLALVILGALFLLDRLNGVAVGVGIAGLWQYWPVLTVIAGLAKLLPPSSPKQVLGGLWLIFISAWWYVSYECLWGFTFMNTWPFFLIAWGVGLVLQPLLERLFDKLADDSNEEVRHEI